MLIPGSRSSRDSSFTAGHQLGGSFDFFLLLASFDTFSYRRVCRKFPRFILFLFFFLFTVSSVNCYFVSFFVSFFFFWSFTGHSQFKGYQVRGLGVDLTRPAGQDLYLTQLPSYEYRDLVFLVMIVRSRTTSGHLARLSALLAVFHTRFSLRPSVFVSVVVRRAIPRSGPVFSFLRSSPASPAQDTLDRSSNQ